jgi:hypothetical protein
MLNHTSHAIPIELITTLYDLETRIKETYNVKGQVEIVRVFNNKYDLLFDGYEKSSMLFRLIGQYDVLTNTFIWI